MWLRPKISSWLVRRLQHRRDVSHMVHIRPALVVWSNVLRVLVPHISAFNNSVPFRNALLLGYSASIAFEGSPSAALAVVDVFCR